MLKCSLCKASKPPAEFNNNIRRPSGKDAYCKQCRAVYRILHPMTKQAQSEANKRYRLKNREKCRARQKSWRDKNKEHCRQTNGILRRKYNLQLKTALLEAYGKSCACCNESNVGFLSIDHINGGGRQHRRDIKVTGTSFYKWLKDNNYPPGYRVLCPNCNMRAARGIPLPNAKR